MSTIILETSLSSQSLALVQITKLEQERHKKRKDKTTKHRQSGTNENTKHSNKGMKVKLGKGNVNLYRACTRNISKVLRYSTHGQGTSQFYLHTLHFIHKRNELYLPFLPSQPQLVLIYRPQRDGRPSRLWCKVDPAEIRTRNLPITSPALYHTATSAPKRYLGKHREQSPDQSSFMTSGQETGWACSSCLEPAQDKGSNEGSQLGLLSTDLVRNTSWQT